MENAAKHNKISKEDPLRIEIFNNGGSQLIVRNNISPREQSVESTGIGLRSIHSRYTLLNQEPPVIRKDGEFFNVLISLIPQKN